jgi:hypothetical protein
MFYDNKIYFSRIGLAPPVRIRIWIRIEVKSWIRIRTENNADPKHWIEGNAVECSYCRVAQSFTRASFFVYERLGGGGGGGRGM